MRVALAQIVSTEDVAANLLLVEEVAARAAEQGADLVVFPEATMRAFGHPLREIAEPIDGPWGTGVVSIARRLDTTIVVGMFTPGEGGRVRNTLLLAGPDATSSYDKVHLFDAFGFLESRTVEPGTTAVTAEVAGTTIGLATCYDIRFPDLFVASARAGARVQIVCASWGAGPGKAAQWELLARSRAIDTTSVVVAVGQGDPRAAGVDAVADAPTGIGHSVVVSPFGEVLHALGADPDLLVVDLDLSAVDDARRTLPVLDNRVDGLV
ncbi:carbon-nitrogen hydrolase family protein [Labedella endophytica]|uniref:Carbon-nitrogen hydrolase family protein n=1 Tax=Labedella endophytica TaxID=1523160 RepID=A0A3S1CUH6_9MICO|nr:carbon-nitrogen hydrolase family protein [Labedella endophytica]RUR03456.1 carbon-nitrogen hydrolase family protein [Labedella endophytica]